MAGGGLMEDEVDHWAEVFGATEDRPLCGIADMLKSACLRRPAYHLPRTAQLPVFSIAFPP